MENLTSESVIRAYRRYSKWYDVLFGSVFHPGRRSAIEHLQCEAGDQILEVGVGTGLSLGLYPENVQITGIDLSSDMLQKAKEKVRSQGLRQVQELVQMDALHMDFADDSFDKVVAMYVASVVPDVAQFAKEIRRVCRPGGRIIFLNHFENKNPLVRRIESTVQPLAHLLGFHPDFPLPKFLQDTGFQISQEIPVNLMNYWTLLITFNDKKGHPSSRQNKTNKSIRHKETF